MHNKEMKNIKKKQITYYVTLMKNFQQALKNKKIHIKISKN